MRSELIEPKKSPWTKTKIPHLYFRQGKQGVRYYARVYVGGKEIWKSLKTNLKSVATERLQELVSNARVQRASGFRLSDGKLTFGDLLKTYRSNFQRDSAIKQNTKNFREAGVKVVLRTWPGIEMLNVRKISVPIVREWLLALHSEAKPYVPRGARTASRNSTGASATTVNCALDAIRHTLDIAVEAGHLFANPARDKSIKRAIPRPKRLELPTREQMQAIFETIESAGVAECKAAAEMVKFLAYTGARKNEANHVLWRDVNFDKGRVTLRITKNSETRDVPMIPECRVLLEKMRANRPNETADTSLLRVKKCRGFLEKACIKVGVKRIGHHDLRHVFATTAIESGMDIPTVSKIMGHKDGGALAMKIYGHLRDEHAQAAMQKVNFGGVAK